MWPGLVPTPTCSFAAAQINEGAALSPQAPRWADQERWETTATGADAIGLCRSAGFANPPSAPLGVSPWFGMSTPCNSA